MKPFLRLIILAYLFIVQNNDIFAHVNSIKGSFEFVKNEGQWDDPSLYRLSLPQATVFLEPKSITYLLSDVANGSKKHNVKLGKYDTTRKEILNYHAYKIEFLNAENVSQTEIGGLQEHYYNYFLGNNPDRWHSKIHPGKNVLLKELYPGIDLYFTTENQELKYEFQLEPKANPDNIKLKFTGVDQVYLKKGVLHVQTSLGIIQELAPYAFQVIKGNRVQVPCHYKLKDNILSYNFPNGYDENAPLIIDPTVVFATYTGSLSDNWGFTATYDNAGNFYAGGIVEATGYPTTLGAFQTTFGGGNGTPGSQNQPWDMGISKFNANGTTLIYSTYLGGSDDEQPHSLIVDASGNLIIAGRTYSANYPVSSGSYDPTHNGMADLVITKFNATGTNLLGSTYVGGTGEDAVNISANGPNASLKHNYGDDARSEVIVDNAGNIYVALPTQSIDFPLTSNAFQNSAQGGQDGAIVKLNSNLSSLIYSTYLGGSQNDAAYVICLDKNEQNIIVGGSTESSNMPIGSGGLWSTYQGGSVDGFIVKFRNSGTYNLVSSTFIGANDYDQVYGVQVDMNDNIYAMGNTFGSGFPITPGTYNNGTSSQFVIKLNANLSNRIYSTRFGTGVASKNNISPVAFMVDTCESVYISGWGGSLMNNAAGQSLVGMPTTPDAVQSTTLNGAGFYFIVLSKDAQNLMYATFLASTSNPLEHVDGGTSRFDKNGIVYQGICGGCGRNQTFPTTQGTVSPSVQSSNCNYLALKIAFNLSAVKAAANANPGTRGCPPFTVNFTNNSSNATNYSWNFGDGSPIDNSTAPSHTFNTPGTYQVKLVASNPSACITRDSVTITIVVESGGVDAKMNVQKLDSCGPFRIQVTNLSTGSGNPGSNPRYLWDFGDGTTSTNPNPGIHSYPSANNYVVKLYIFDTTACNSPDSVLTVVDFNASNIKAGFNIPDSICVGDSITFQNTSISATSNQWNFGDGRTSVSTSPSHRYNAEGEYEVKLIVTNPTTCNKVDSIKKKIVVGSKPTADFSFEPSLPIPNEPIYFKNNSTNATSYHWDFGDGSTSKDKDPVHFFNKKGANNVCLTVVNIFGCRDVVCKKVYSDVKTFIDVPSAFTPNGDNVNDVLYAQGAGIKTMLLKIYNRWGEVVFESTSLAKGWDGTYNGVPQEMEAYGYTLEAKFIDDTEAVKKGNITLIR